MKIFVSAFLLLIVSAAVTESKPDIVKIDKNFNVPQLEKTPVVKKKVKVSQQSLEKRIFVNGKPAFEYFSGNRKIYKRYRNQDKKMVYEFFDKTGKLSKKYINDFRNLYLQYDGKRHQCVYVQNECIIAQNIKSFSVTPTDDARKRNGIDMDNVIENDIEVTDFDENVLLKISRVDGELVCINADKNTFAFAKESIVEDGGVKPGKISVYNKIGKLLLEVQMLYYDVFLSGNGRWFVVTENEMKAAAYDLLNNKAYEFLNLPGLPDLYSVDNSCNLIFDNGITISGESKKPL